MLSIAHCGKLTAGGSAGIAAVVSAFDQFWQNVTLRLSGDGSNGGTVFTNADERRHTVTGVGNVATTNVRTAFGSASMYFDGAGDKLTLPASQDWNLGNDFTIEGWLNPTSLPTAGNACRILMIGTNGSSSALSFTILPTGNIGIAVPYATIAALFTGPNMVVVNQWHHYAVSVIAGVARIFVDGVMQAGPTPITTQTPSTTDALAIGFDTVGTVNYNYQGYVDEFRITKGVGRYTGNFAVQSSPFGSGDVANFATWSTIDKTPNATLANSNLTVSSTVSFYFSTSIPLANVRASVGVSSGKHYWEVSNWTDVSGYMCIGIAQSDALIQTPYRPGFTGVMDKTWGFIPELGKEYHLDVAATYGVIPVTKVVGFALDMDAGTLSLVIDGVNRGVMFSGLTGTIYPAMTTCSEGGPVTANFGNTPFTWQVPAGYRAGLYSGAVVTDPYWANVQLLTHMNDVDGSTTVVDEAGCPITITSPASISTSTSKFGGSSFKLNGGGYGLINTPVGGFGTGDFTIEAFVYPTANPTAVGQFILASSGANGIVFGYNTLTSWGLVPSGGTWKISSTTMPALNVWSHVVVSRQSGTLRLFMNGVLLTSVANDVTNFVANTTYIGHPTAANSFPGYIDEMRITSGIARYIGNYNVPAASFPDNTIQDPYWNQVAMLMHMDNSFLDCKNGLAITNSGVTFSSAVSKFGGFAANFVRSSVQRFTVTSDKLYFGTNDFTIEGWYNFASIASDMSVMASNWNGGWNATGWWMGLWSGASNKFIASLYGASKVLTDPTVPVINTWYHYAIVRSGTNLYLYRNGVLVDSATIAAGQTLGDPTRGLIIGCIADNLTTTGAFDGRMDDLRITNGAARYLSNFVPPLRSFVNR